MSTNIIKIFRSLFILVSLNFYSSIALAGIFETGWDFAPGEIVTLDTSTWTGGGDGAGYLCSKFNPKKVSLRISFEGTIPPRFSTGGTGVQKDKVSIITPAGKIMESTTLEGIEKLEFTVWNGGGIYKIENITGVKLEGRDCTAGFEGLNNPPFDWESYNH